MPNAEQSIARHTRRAFLGLAGAGAAAILGWEWIWSRPLEDGVPAPFRRILDFNGRLASGFLFDDRHLAPQFPASRIGSLRPNGDIGLSDDLEDDGWKVSVTPYSSGPPGEVALADIRALPKSKHTTEFKCIEGWSTVVQWGGARFSDFVAVHAPGSERANFVSLVTPDREYFVGIDMPSMMHPQTLLCYEMNGRPLEEDHGAPLRLVTPVKYGIKSLKRIAAISFTGNRPPDYWANQGYDYYAGL